MTSLQQRQVKTFRQQQPSGGRLSCEASCDESTRFRSQRVKIGNGRRSYLGKEEDRSEKS